MGGQRPPARPRGTPPPLPARHRHFALPGCFALTEIGHGSNARELETVARYEPASGQFVVNSPNFAAGKNYIGNLVRDGRAATVFAQLETADGARHGVHAFVVPLRDEQGNVLPGVRIEDNGPKMGENGVDNGRVWFDNVRVDRDALLDRFGGVAADGTYHSPIKSAGARFFAIISALVGGRISIAAAGVSAAKSGLAIAVRYSERRRQFRTPGVEGETPLLHYPTHQRRLMPLLANAYAADFALKYLVRRRVETQDGRRPGGHARGRAAGGVVQGVGDVEHHAHAANLPRGVRRRGLHQRQPVARAQGRHGYFHDVRGRQHRAHALGRAQPARRRARANSAAHATIEWLFAGVANAVLDNPSGELLR